MIIGLIGVGKLGTALVKGFINGGVRPDRIHVYDVSTEALNRVKPFGISICSTAEEVVERSDAIIVAVKPQDIVDVIKEVAPKLSKDKILISTAAFVPLKTIEKHAPKCNVYRVMPNIAAEVNKGFTALTPPERKSEEVENLFKILGETVWVKEEVLDLLTVVSASIPALVAELYDAFVLAALKAGVPYDIARKAVAVVFQGVGEMMKLRDVSSVRDSVITPRGVTISLIEKFYAYEVKNRLVEALVDSIEEYLERLATYRKSFE